MGGIKYDYGRRRRRGRYHDYDHEDDPGDGSMQLVALVQPETATQEEAELLVNVQFEADVEPDIAPPAPLDPKATFLVNVELVTVIGG